MGDKYVDEYVCSLLIMFLSEHWRMFEHFCSERGANAGETYQYLSG